VVAFVAVAGAPMGKEKGEASALHAERDPDLEEAGYRHYFFHHRFHHHVHHLKRVVAWKLKKIIHHPEYIVKALAPVAGLIGGGGDEEEEDEEVTDDGGLAFDDYDLAKKWG